MAIQVFLAKATTTVILTHGGRRDRYEILEDAAKHRFVRRH